MNMKNAIIPLIFSIFSVILLVGCAVNNRSNELEKTITISGSTSVQPLSEELAAIFMNKYRGIRVEVAGGGSGSGISAAQENTVDFGAVSRKVRGDETGVDTYIIAIDGIAIIVHPDNRGIDDTSIDDIRAIFTGEITNWSEVGGVDENIVTVSREEGSGTRVAFDDIVLRDTELVDTALIQNSGGAVRETVASETNAIGYVSIGSLNDNVKTLNINSVKPTSENIVAGNYSLARPFYYVANTDKPLSDLAKAFLNFILSDEGQVVVEDHGYVKVN